MVTYMNLYKIGFINTLSQWGGAHSDPSLRSSRRLIIVGRGRSIFSSGVATDKVPVLL